jgi:hypothetical protein
MKSFPSSPYAQHAMKSFLCMPNMHSDIHVKTAKFERWLSIHKNSFGVCSVCDEIVSSYAQCAIKLFPRMLSMCMLKFSNMTQKQSRNSCNRTKVNILKTKFFLIAHQKNWIPRVLSHCENVLTSKFWRKSKEKK